MRRPPFFCSSANNHCIFTSWVIPGYLFCVKELDCKPSYRNVRHLDLFSGIGGFSLAAQEVWGSEHEIAAFCDNDAFCQQVLRKHWPDANIYGDIRTIKGREFGAVDLVTGGFPCQPFSQAGKRRGTRDDRYLWPEMLRVIRETFPAWVIGENVAGIINLALEDVCASLENSGYEVQPFVIPACAVDAPHRRDRIWIVARALSAGTKCKRREIANERRKTGEGGAESLRQAHGKVGPSGFTTTNRDDREFAPYASHDGREWRTEAKRRQVENRKKRSALWVELGGQDRRADDASNPKGGESNRRGRESLDEAKTGRKSVHASPRISNQDTSTNERADFESRDFESRKDPTPEQYGTDFGRQWHEVAAELCRMDDGLPAKLDGFELSMARHRVERLKSLGNAIVPQVAREIMQTIRVLEAG